MENSAITKSKKKEFSTSDTLTFRKPGVIILIMAIVLIIALNLVQAIIAI